MDQNKKTMRHFYCRDVLWDTFEQMANDFDCSIDYLINEAMRYYARSKNYGAQAGAPAPGPGAPARPPSQSISPPGGVPRRPPPPPSGPAPTAGAASAGAAGQPGYSARRTVQHQAHRPPEPPGRRPPPGARPGVEAAGGPTLFLIFNNQKIAIDKDQFIIGRGSKTSDLAIKDGNISRKHAAIIRRNGTYYIKDLGSTNGIDYKGMRIDNKRIDEGDVFHLCDYELRFTYRG
ncbi:MAG: FHA domain-containing protein [Deltaproteobacteria bacterium]|nr:FHA domain-containing protein [Deltaproteobacteria bacterium]